MLRALSAPSILRRSEDQMARDASCWGHVRTRIAILDEHAGAFPSLEYVRSTSIAVFAAHVAVGTPNKSLLKIPRLHHVLPWSERFVLLIKREPLA